MFPGDDQVDRLREQIEAARLAEEQLFAPDQADSGEIDPTFIRSCLYNNERGDGILFARIHRGRFVMVKSWGKNGTWMQWAGHHWQIDKTDQAHNAVEDVAQLYLGESLRLKTLIDASPPPSKDDQKQLEAERALYSRRVNKLRSVAGARNCLEWATRIGDLSLAIIGDDIDLHPWLLPCKNGVIDLRTGKFSPGRPEDYLLRAIPVEWQGIDHPCPTFDRFFDEIHLSDAALIAYLDRLFGYTLTGLTTNHFIGVFLGEGRNGKGTLFETLRYIMGDLAWNISPELLIEQKNTRSSAGPSPDLISLQGRRMVIASECDDNRRISGQQVKRLTGGDTINGRAPHDRDETNFAATWKIFFYSNYIPKGMATGFALADRLVYIEYPLKFVEDPDPADPTQRPRDPELPAKLKGEAAGILARLVRGCLAWQELGGLYPPASIRESVNQLQKTEDTFRRWFEEEDDTGRWVNIEKSDDPDAKVAFKDLYGAFSAWYADEVSETDKYRPTKRAVSLWLDKHGYVRRKPSGIATVYGIRLLIGGQP